MMNGENAIMGGKSAYDNIRVVVRSRPFSEDEKKLGASHRVFCDHEMRCVNVSLRGDMKKRFTYDAVFGPNSTQSEVYENSIRPVVDEVLQGYNCTVFAYGQTGTGKTYTMEGMVDDPHTRGMIPRAVSTIFESLDGMEGAEYTVKVSFLELYNEELQDLLSATDDVKLRIIDDKNRMHSGVTCMNLEQVMVSTPEDILSIMKDAMAKRQVGETNLNKASSRSHCIFSLTLHTKETTPEGEDLLKVGKLNLVDLAGSECIGRSGATNARAREAGNINRSLLTLGRVISALVEKAPHVPYRDSKLTRLLQESLGGRCKTCIIATVAPSVQCLDETLSTLEYASRAKTIKNKPEANLRLTKKALIKEYAEDLERLRQELAAARAKDGVFLDESRYNDMCSQLESQSHQIEELEDLIGVKGKEITELKEQLKQLSDDFLQVQDLLKNTKDELTQTHVKLEENIEELTKQTNQLEETRVLVDAHQKTEENLREGMMNLNNVLTQARNDTKELHAKIERKGVVERKNRQVTHSYRDETVQVLSDFSQKSALFFEKQLKSHASIESLMTDYSADHSKRTKEILDAVRAIDSESRTGINTLTKVHAEGIRDLLTSHISQQKETEQSREAIMGDKFEDAETSIRSPLAQIVEVVLVEQNNLLASHVNSVRTRLEKAKTDAQEFQNANEKNTQALAEKIKQNMDATRRSVEEQSQALSASFEEESTRIDSASEDLMMNISKMVEAFKNDAKEKLVRMSQRTEEMRKQSLLSVDKREMESIELISSVSSHTRAWCESNENTISILREDLENECKTMAQSFQETKCGVDSAIQSLKKKTSDLAKYSSNHRCDFEKACDGASNSFGQLFSELTDHANIVTEKSSNGLKQAEKASEELQKCTSALTSSTKENCQKRSAELSGFNEQVRVQVVEMDSRCKTFATDEIVDDIPTCRTPKRKKYECLAKIPDSVDHESVLEGYRKQKAENLLVKSSDEQQERRVDTTNDDHNQTLDKTASDSEEKPGPSTSRQETVLLERSCLKDVSNHLTTRLNVSDAAGSSQLLKTTLDDVSPRSSESHEAGKLQNDENQNIPNSDPPPNEIGGISEKWIKSLTVSGLRKELKARKLSQLGNKQSLQNRLLNVAILEVNR